MQEKTKKPYKMNIELDRFELLYYIEGCMIGSHLRQGIWERCIDEFYGKLSDDERNFIFHYAVRDFWGRQRRFANREFKQFIARFNPDNQYTMKSTLDIEGADAQNAYFFEGRYYLGSRLSCADDMFTPIKNEERLNMYIDTYRHLYYEIKDKVQIKALENEEI